MTFTEILLSLCPVAIGIISFLYKEVKSEINMLEHDLKNKTDEQQVRQMVDDKVTPVKESLENIQASISKILDHLLDKK